jgi:hypothetical protein
MSDNRKSKKQNGGGLFSLALKGIFLAMIAFPAWKTYKAEDPLIFMLPNFLLYTPFREATRSLWNSIIKIDKTKPIEPRHVPVIEAKDYTYEKLKEATENWRYPAVVRGIFNNCPATKKWPTADYFSSRIGKYKIPVVHQAIVGKVQNNRSVMPFEEAYKDIWEDPKSKTYLFFPVQSRFNFNGSDAGSLKELQKEVNDMVLNDLQLDRIWKGFGTASHSTYFGSQLIIGKGTNDTAETTGTGWHCAAGNNWFAQVR